MSSVALPVVVSTEAHSAGLLQNFINDSQTLVWTATGVLALGAILASVALFKSRYRVGELKAQVNALEKSLNEAEAAMKSEPHIMLVWNGMEQKLLRMVGSMRGTVEIPERENILLAFSEWLERDSAKNLEDSLSALRLSGKAFSIGVRTLKHDLLEADGRAAGGLATLRFRPLAGDRKSVTELTYDADKLARQVERLSTFLDQAPFPMWIKSNEGQLTWVNQSYLKAVEALDVQTALRVRAPLVAVETIDAKKADTASGLLGRGHAVQGGQRRAFNVYEQPVVDAIAGFALDVTSHEHLEKELERHISAHASTLDKIDTAIAIFGPDQHLRFFNRAYVSLWGMDETWLKTQPSDGEILDQLRARRVLPEQANFREWRSKHLASYTTLETRESYWYLPDGRSLHVVCEQHPFGGVTYLFENLTKEYQLESKYNELFDVQRETLDNLAEAVGLFGTDGKLKLCNPAFKRLWQIDMPVAGDGPHVDRLTQNKTLETDARSAWTDIKFGITGLESQRKPVEGRFSNGGIILRYRAVPLADGNALVTFTDVSDAVRAEQALRDRTEALEAADRLKTNFLANVSYEIRTPLTSIAGFAEGLEYGIAGQMLPKQKEYVLDIRRSAADLGTIIDAIIDLSAIDAGAMELKLEEVVVDDMMERATTRVLAALERRNQTIAIEVAANVPTITGDGARLEQVIGHLLSNASGFSDVGARIVMGARRIGDQVQIWVADTGKGIDAEFQSKAFERFQAKPSPGSHRGPGLGLSLVKAFTELHGGRVSLVSKLDQGTTVVCSLPVAGPHKTSSVAA